MEERVLTLFIDMIAQSLDNIKKDAIELLKQMIAIPSFSREEQAVANHISQFLSDRGIQCKRLLNNIYATHSNVDLSRPTIILNSHHDTVKPVHGYTLNPFEAIVQDGKLYGLGSNDAGGSLTALIATFLYFSERNDLPFNLCLIASAEEEVSGKNGVELVLNDPDFIQHLGRSVILGGIVGEPTRMEMAVAERGLLVVDGWSKGIAGHAAREEGLNAISIALRDIEAIHALQFEKISALTGKTTAKVTVVETENKAHNVIPSSCKFVMDVRVNELYTFEEVMKQLQSVVQSELRQRSFRLRSTMIALDHPLVKAGLQMGIPYYGSPTTSDKALMRFPALKMGPGHSARSHTADEYIFIEEIEKGIEGYIRLLESTQLTA